MASEIIAGIGAFKAMMDIAKALKDMDTAAARNAAVIELQEKIFAANTAQTTLLQRVGNLEKEVAGFEAWDREKQRYTLVPLHDGALTYRLKEAEAKGEPMHYICANCYEQKIKSVLQGATYEFHGHVLKCLRCKAEYQQLFSEIGTWNRVRFYHSEHGL